jgi:hypothetical protein
LLLLFELKFDSLVSTSAFSVVVSPIRKETKVRQLFGGSNLVRLRLERSWLELLLGLILAHLLLWRLELPLRLLLNRRVVWLLVLGVERCRVVERKLVDLG